MDFVVQHPSGKWVGYEVKSGNAFRSTSQLAKDKIISSSGGMFVGKNAPNSLRGRIIPIDIWELRY
jgi:hypothetical protein